jgi:hypothetical protein
MRLVVNLGLFLIAGLLVAVLFPFAVVFAIVKGIYKRKLRDWSMTMNTYFYSMAFALDKFGNVLIAPMFNTIMIVTAPQFLLFGNPNETISSCLGRNGMHGNLSWLGSCLCYLLNLIDENHCEKAAIKFMSNKQR